MTKLLASLGVLSALALPACSTGGYDAASPYAHAPIEPIATPASFVMNASHTGRAASSPPRSADLRVMSFNLRVPFVLDGLNHWGFRKELLVSTIEAFSPDLLGTQECTLEQATYLVQQMPNYDWVGVGRDDGATKGEMTAIFWRSDRFTKLDDGHFWLSETPERVGSKGWDAGWRRVTTWVKLRERSTGRVVVHFNTHFDVFGDTARIESAELLRERIVSIAAGLPTIVTGDFNCPENSPPYHLLVGDALLDDVYRDVHRQDVPKEGTRHGFDGRAGDNRIDWILATAGFDTAHAAIDRTTGGNGRYPSDHFPVTAVLRFDDREAAMLLAAARAAGVAQAGL